MGESSCQTLFPALQITPWMGQAKRWKHYIWWVGRVGTLCPQTREPGWSPGFATLYPYNAGQVPSFRVTFQQVAVGDSQMFVE
jgi:hypothetical protein